MSRLRLGGPTAVTGGLIVLIASATTRVVGVAGSDRYGRRARGADGKGRSDDSR